MNYSKMSLALPITVIVLGAGQRASALDPIAPGDFTVSLQPVATGLTSPLDLQHAGDGSGRLFVTDQAGQIHLLKDGAIAPEPFLDVSSRLVSFNPGFDERGLLGVAFHPEFADPTSAGFGRLYTYTSEPVVGSADFSTTVPTTFNHQSVVSEWQVDPLNSDRVDPTSRRELLRIDQPQGNHNAGTMRFRPSDGYLYIALGDGGGGNDDDAGHSLGGNGQDLSNVHGSILRIDPLDPGLTTGSADPISNNGQYRTPAGNPFVGDADVPDEIFAYGFRNPWKFSVDEPTDRVLVADAGQFSIEEVDLLEHGGNYGWPRKEGSFLFDQSDGSISEDPVVVPGLTDPVLEYSNDEGQVVIGGHVYRGSLLSGLEGKYIFGDLGLGQGRLFYGDLDDGTIKELLLTLDVPLDVFLFGIGEGPDGELYVLGSSSLSPAGGGSGKIYRIVPEPAIAVLMSFGAMIVIARRRRQVLSLD